MGLVQSQYINSCGDGTWEHENVGRNLLDPVRDPSGSASCREKKVKGCLYSPVFTCQSTETKPGELPWEGG